MVAHATAPTLEPPSPHREPVEVLGLARHYSPTHVGHESSLPHRRRRGSWCAPRRFSLHALGLGGAPEALAQCGCSLTQDPMLKMPLAPPHSSPPLLTPPPRSDEAVRCASLVGDGVECSLREATGQFSQLPTCGVRCRCPGDPRISAWQRQLHFQALI